MNIHFQDKSHIKNDFFRFILLHLEFHFFYCSKDLKSLSLCTLHGVWRVDFYEKKSNLKKSIFCLYFISLRFSSYYCSKDLKRQLQHSGTKGCLVSQAYLKKDDSFCHTIYECIKLETLGWKMSFTWKFQQLQYFYIHKYQSKALAFCSHMFLWLNGITLLFVLNNYYSAESKNNMNIWCKI